MPPVVDGVNAGDQAGVCIVDGSPLVGIVGPATNHIAWRELGIFGYAVIFPITCLAISRAFKDRSEV